jgi:hypothetical protein
MLRFVRGTLLLLCLGAAVARPASAQVTPVPLPTASPAAANSAPTLYDIQGVIHDAGGVPIPNARVEARGPVTVSTKTDAHGAYDLQVPPGIYSVTVSKYGYESATQNTLSVVNGSVNASVNLVASVSSNLKTIANVGAEANTQSTFNTTAASVQTITPQDFEDQGQESVARMLDEIPGVSTPQFQSWAFGLVLPNVTLTPQLRGAFPYETAQSFDGFPLLSATPGFGFNANMITTIGLGGINIIKGPGAESPTVNGAVGGTIDYLSIDPTPKQQLYASSSTDGYGGSILKMRASGTFGRLGYVVGYSAYNTPGYWNDYYDGPFVYMDYGLVVDGKAMPCYYIWYCNAYNEGTSVPYKPNSQLDYTATPWIMCCRSLDSGNGQFSEYGKLNYQLTPPGNPLSATLDVMYFGSQSRLETGGFNNYMSAIFEPPPGYTGSFPAGTYNLPAWNGDISSVDQNQNIFEMNLRAKVGPGYLRLGGFSLYQWDNDSDFGAANLTPGASSTYTVWGGIPYGALPTTANPNPAPQWQIFNGQTAQVSDLEYYTQGEYAHQHDWIADYQVPIANNSVGISWTQASINPDQSVFYNLGPSVLWDNFPAENFNQLKQTNNEFRLTSSLQASPKLEALVSLYYDEYINRLSPENSPLDIPNDPAAVQQYVASFSNNYSYALNPRAALTYRLNEDTSLRFSTGGALVPLPIESLAVGGTPPTYDATNGWWTQSIAPVGLKPETSWGYDVGADVRIPKDALVMSTDLYTTALQNQFMTITQPDGTYQGAPLYSTQLANFGHSRYEGVELSVHRIVPKGFGFSLSGFLERGYPYDIPANFYTSLGQPVNQTFIPGVNFNNGAGEYGGIGGGGGAIIPYSGGYGEVSYRFGRNSLVRFGAQYYGKYNTFFEPPFFVLSASARYGFTPHLGLQISVDNLGNMYTLPYQGSGEPAYANLPSVPLYGGGTTYGYYEWVGRGSLTTVELVWQ